MSDERTEHAGSRRTLTWDHPISLLMLVVLTTAVTGCVQFSFGRFPWFQTFESRHGFWVLLLLSWAVVPLQFIFRRRQRLADQLRFRQDLRAGRVYRMSLVTRCMVMVVSLGLVVTGSLVKDGKLFLLFGIPVLLLFAVEELNIILRPGDSVRTNPRDELLAYFKARTLQVGYVVAIVSMTAVYLVSLFATRYVSALLPLGLTMSLLVPSLLFSRLDHRADIDE